MGTESVMLSGMTQRLPGGYVFNPADPRAPSTEQWKAMTDAERAQVVDMLPTGLPVEVAPPEGDDHRIAKNNAFDALNRYFRKQGRKIYLSSELIVLYPNEPAFVPDLMAVLDVDPHRRMRWVVEVEGKGPDLVIEVHVAGDRNKDERLNVERYARLGIHEYFVFDRARLRLFGFRLPPALASKGGSRVYQRMIPQAGLFSSEVLGLDLGLQGERLRFFTGDAVVEDADERIARLGAMLDNVIAHQEEALRAAEQGVEELRSKLDEEQRLREEERQRREEIERRLAEAYAEIEKLKGS